MQLEERKSLQLAGHQSGRLRCHFSITSNQNPFDLVQADRITAALIKLRCVGRCVVGHMGGLFQGSPVFQIGGDAGGPEGVAAHCHMFATWRL